MDIDISDILADVSKLPSSSSGPLTHDYTPSTYTDHQLLVRSWTSERCSPSLLPYPTQLIERTLSRVQAQITRIEDLTSGVEFATAGPGGGGVYTSGKPSNNTNLILSIIQTDLSRTQFILRSYLRQRLAKVTRYAGYYLKYHVDSTSTSSPSSDLLSQSEVQFLQHHQALLAEFYDASFLGSFPVNLRRLDDSAGGNNMVERPDGGMGVVVRCLREEWGNSEDVGVGEDDDEDEDDKADVELRMRRGEVWVVRWRDVRRGVVDGDLECL